MAGSHYWGPLALLLLYMNLTRGKDKIFLATETCRLIIDMDFNNVIKEMGKLEKIILNYRSLETEFASRFEKGANSGQFMEAMVQSHYAKHQGKLSV